MNVDGAGHSAVHYTTSDNTPPRTVNWRCRISQKFSTNFDEMGPATGSKRLDFGVMLITMRTQEKAILPLRDRGTGAVLQMSLIA